MGIRVEYHKRYSDLQSITFLPFPRHLRNKLRNQGEGPWGGVSHEPCIQCVPASCYGVLAPASGILSRSGIAFQNLPFRLRDAATLI
jgi:hypothetical protein